MDVVILEVGLGGRLDATNCVRDPVVCGISSLGFDHMELLGYTLEVRRWRTRLWRVRVRVFQLCQAGLQPDDAMLAAAPQEIAGEKAGILKPGCPAFTAPQPANAMGALQRRAEEVGAPLRVAPSFDSLRWAGDDARLPLTLCASSAEWHSLI